MSTTHSTHQASGETFKKYNMIFTQGRGTRNYLWNKKFKKLKFSTKNKKYSILIVYSLERKECKTHKIRLIRSVKKSSLLRTKTPSHK